jgi:small ligand-binding sensory domain FIST
VRDPASSQTELDTLAARWQAAHPGVHAAGALLVSCLGRGQPFFGEADHDPRHLQAAIGNVSVSGFFAAGELGPLGRGTHLHTYTTCVAVFSEPRWD